MSRRLSPSTRGRLPTFRDQPGGHWRKSDGVIQAVQPANAPSLVRRDGERASPMSTMKRTPSGWPLADEWPRTWGNQQRVHAPPQHVHRRAGLDWMHFNWT